MTDLLREGILQSRGRPASTDDIDAFEEERGISLPAEYRSFLSEGDGATFREYNEVEGEWTGGPRELFALADPDGSTRTLSHILRVYNGRVPREFLPFADNSGGDLFLLGVSGSHTGEVFFWDHEMEAEEGDPPTTENMRQVAGSLEDFLHKVKLI